MNLKDALPIRKRITMGPPCSLEDGHDWTYVEEYTVSGNDKVVLFILCHDCGRTPLEILNQMEIWP